MIARALPSRTDILIVGHRTLEWLLSEANSSTRWRKLRLLLDRSEDDPEMVAAAGTSVGSPSMGHDAAVPDQAGTRTIDVVIEIPRGSRNKYEFDHETHRIRLDRRLFSATVYPADYGFIPDSLGEDGDPLDALVLLEDPTFPGCWVTARPVGVFWMEDDKGPDAKIICVPAGDPRWEGVNDIEGIPQLLRAEIQHFFDVYKMLEPDKHSTTRGYEGAVAAWAEIEEALARYPGSGS